MFLTESDFIGKYSIPNSVNAPTSLQDFINQTEEEVLVKLFGDDLYNEFIVGIVVDPDADPLVIKADIDIEQKWLDLRDGNQYEYTAKVYRYSGIKSFLIPYIYQAWIAKNVKRLTPTGMKRPKVENADQADPSDEIWIAYTEFKNLIGSFIAKTNTLYGFLSVHYISVYTTWTYASYYSPVYRHSIYGGSKNSFGL